MNDVTALNIVCPACQATNRVPAARLTAQPRCGACHVPLFEAHSIEVNPAGFERHVGGDEVPVLVDLWAPWCGPCRTMAPWFERAATTLEPHYRLLKLNADTAPEILTRYGVRSIPTLLLFYRGRLLASDAGAMPADRIIHWAQTNVQINA